MLACRSPPPRAIQDTGRHTPRYERTDSQDEEEKRGAVASKDGERESPNLRPGKEGKEANHSPLFAALSIFPSQLYGVHVLTASSSVIGEPGKGGAG